MTYANAKKLHNGDEVIVKGTGEVLTVVQVYCPRPMNMIQRKEVFVECNDCNTYHHADIR
jgi:hypothetical protein